MSQCGGARGRNRTGMGFIIPRDFKSLASTYFATRAIFIRHFIMEAGNGIEPMSAALQAAA